MVKYYLTLRPCVEILAVDASKSFVVSRPTPSGLQSETDLLSLVSSLSVDAYEAIRHVRLRTTSLFLLLSTSGVIIYMLYKRRKGPETPEVRQRLRRPRWSSSNGNGWLWWLMGETDEGIVSRSANEEHFIYFGPDLNASRRLGALGSNVRSRKENLKQSMIVPGLMRNSSSSRKKPMSEKERIQIAPCPNCLRGTCRLKKHHHFHHIHDHSAESSSYTGSPLHVEQQNLFPPTSTPESADDESSDFDDVSIHTARAERFRSRFFRPGDHRVNGDGSPSDIIASANGNTVPNKSSNTLSTTYDRIPPIGQEISEIPSICGDPNCTDPHCQQSSIFKKICRDESVDSSLMSVSGSMADLVKGAREIRRLIREGSFDSIISDLELEMNENLGQLPNQDFKYNDHANEGLNALENWDRFDPISASGPNSLASSKSDYVLSTSQNDQSERSRSPDVLLLKRRPSKHFWKTVHTANSSDVESLGDAGSLEWESPLHGWHDLRKHKYKLALSSNQSIASDNCVDDLEWDSHEFGLALDENASKVMCMIHHQKWLPENAEKLELDLEAELSSYPHSSLSAGSSRRGSVDRSSGSSFSFTNRVRLPPSGRSSVDRGSGDTPKETIDHASLIKSFGVYPSQTEQNIMKSSMTSEESGFQDSYSMETSTSSHHHYYPLSPVHEAKEEPTPVRRPAHSDEDRKTIKCNKILFKSSEENVNSCESDDAEEQIAVIVESQTAV